VGAEGERGGGPRKQPGPVSTACIRCSFRWRERLMGSTMQCSGQSARERLIAPAGGGVEASRWRRPRPLLLLTAVFTRQPPRPPAPATIFPWRPMARPRSPSTRSCTLHPASARLQVSNPSHFAANALPTIAHACRGCEAGQELPAAEATRLLVMTAASDIDRAVSQH
jgi:hypothetical protein